MEFKSKSADRLAAISLTVKELDKRKIRSLKIDWRVIMIDGEEELVPTLEIVSRSILEGL